MGISAPRLRQSRHGVFVFRYLVPPKFRELFGKKELRRSLRTKNAVDARVQALNLNTVIERLLKHLPPENAMNEIKKLMDAGIHSWEVEVNGVKFKTDGTKADAENLVEHLVEGKLKHILDEGMRQGRVYVGASEIPPPTAQEIAKAIYTSLVEVAPAAGDGPLLSTLATSAHLHPIAKPKKPLQIRHAIDGFLKNYEDKATEKTADSASSKPKSKASSDRKTTMNALVDFINSGACTGITLDSYVHELETEHFTEFLSYYAKREPQKLKDDHSKNTQAAVSELPLESQGKGSIENQALSVSTLNKQKSFVTVFIEFCRKKLAIHPSSDLLGSKFAEDLSDEIASVTSGNRKSISYKPFEHAELQKLFEADIYFWCTRAQPNYFWAPLIALHTGMRGKEIATLTLKSIREHADLDLFTIQLYEDRTKNLNSSRQIPIPQRLIELGFIDYVKFLHEATKDLPLDEKEEYPLFPNVNTKAATFQSDPHKNISRSFSVYRRMKYFGLDLNYKVFHSFRHTVVSLLDARGVDIKSQMEIVGHTESDDGDSITTDHWSGRVKGLRLETNRRYTKEVVGFNTQPLLVRNKKHLDDCCELYELDYYKLKLAAQTVQKMLVCKDLAQQKWHAGFRSNQKGLKNIVPAELYPQDMSKCEDFDWR